MAAKVTTTLTSIAEVSLRGKTELGLTLTNTGSTALNAFQVQFQMTPGGSWKTWTLTWASPALNYPLKNNADGNDDPTSLGAGETMQFVFDGLRTQSAVRFMASVASGNTEVSVETSPA